MVENVQNERVPGCISQKKLYYAQYRGEIRTLAHTNKPIVCEKLHFQAFRKLC